MLGPRLFAFRATSIHPLSISVCLFNRAELRHRIAVAGSQGGRAGEDRSFGQHYCTTTYPKL
jgi:hypothetical protein